MEQSALSYNEFLAFLMVYGAGMNTTLNDEELDFIKQRTGIHDINAIKAMVEGMSDAMAMELIDEYKKKYVSNKESEAKIRRDLEELLKAPGQHSQFEKVVVHLIEKLL